MTTAHVASGAPKKGAPSPLRHAAHTVSPGRKKVSQSKALPRLRNLKQTTSPQVVAQSRESSNAGFPAHLFEHDKLSRAQIVSDPKFEAWRAKLDSQRFNQMVWLHCAIWRYVRSVARSCSIQFWDAALFLVGSGYGSLYWFLRKPASYDTPVIRRCARVFANFRHRVPVDTEIKLILAAYDSGLKTSGIHMRRQLALKELIWMTKF